YSPILAPAANTGQTIHDFNNVPIEVNPFSATSYANVPLIVPVIPAGSQGVLAFSLTPPPDVHGDSTYSYYASLGDPYGQGDTGAPSSAVVTDLVNGAKSYAETNLGVSISPQVLSQMTTYATAQLNQDLSDGEQALLISAQGGSIFFSTSQLS